MSTGGLSCSTSPINGNPTGGYTYLNSNNTIDANGTITHWCFHSWLPNGNNSVKLKIFRINGSNYDYIGESATVVPTATGIWDDACNISVQAGDLVGVAVITNSSPSGNPVSADGGANNFKYISGDITTNTAQTSWSDGSAGQIIVHVDSTTSVIYVDINKADDTGNGLSWATAKKTMNAAYSAMDAGGTMYVASGDYSGQTGITYNKSWKLAPSDPNSTGSKNVKIPPSV